MRWESAMWGARAIIDVRRVAWCVLAVAALALLSASTQARDAGAQGRSVLRHCRGVRVGTVEAVHVRASYRCSSARKDLKSLLRRGVATLPARKTALGRWRCRKDGATRICKRARRGRRTSRILFRTASTVRQKAQAPSPDSVAPSPESPPPGSGAPPTPTPPKPAPQDCIDLWNASDSHAFAQDGYHFYLDHGIRKGWVFHMSDGTGRCAVIFVDPPSDPYYYEYGTDGETENKARNGWILMDSNDAFGAHAVEVQTQARENANVSLSSLGTIAPL
jgi:hypothetical protein